MSTDAHDVGFVVLSRLPGEERVPDTRDAGSRAVCQTAGGQLALGNSLELQRQNCEARAFKRFVSRFRLHRVAAEAKLQVSWFEHEGSFAFMS